MLRSMIIIEIYVKLNLASLGGVIDIRKLETHGEGKRNTASCRIIVVIKFERPGIT